MILALAFLLAAQPTGSVPADSLRLQWAYAASATHYPGARETGLIDRTHTLRLRNLQVNYLPSISLSGHASYQSEVASIPLDIPGMAAPSVPHDQYKLGLGLEQLLYDGGVVSGQKAVEAAASAVASQEVRVAAYAIRMQVEEAFFGVLMADAQAASLEVLHGDVTARHAQVAALVRGGASTQSNADVLRAEIIAIEQRQTVAGLRRRAALDALGLLTGTTLPDDAVLALPSNRLPSAGRRPERALFDLRRAQFDRQAALAGRRTNPNVRSFAEAAYGRPPGLNLFEEEFAPFFSVGVRMSWHFWDWRSAQRDRQVLALQQQIVDARESAFDQSLRVSAAQVMREIEQAESLLERDAEIIAIRAGIVAEAASRLANGTATATDYLVEKNAEYQAHLSERQHRIQLAFARARYISIVGEE